MLVPWRCTVTLRAVKATSILPVLTLVLVLGLSLQTGLADDFFEEVPDFAGDFEKEPWQEEEVPLPPFPEERDLLKFTVPQASSRVSYAIDTGNLQVGDDGVVRYTVIISTSSGARNVFFEGIRCDERTYKTYAYGHDGESFRKRSAPRWRPIPLRGNQSFRRDLHGAYFCNRFGVVRTPEEIMTRLRGGFTLDL